MGFYGNYYKIKSGNGLQTEEQGQQTIISFSQAVADILGVTGEGENQTTSLSKRLTTIETEIGLLNPESSLGAQAATRIDDLDIALGKINESKIEKDENGIYGIKDGEYYIIPEGEEYTGQRYSITKATSPYLDALRRYLGIDSWPENNNDLSGGRIDKLETEILGTDNDDYNNSRIDQLANKLTLIENELSGTSTTNDIENSRLDKIDSVLGQITSGTDGFYQASNIESIKNDIASIKDELSGTPTEENGIEGSRLDKIDGVLGTIEGEGTEENPYKAMNIKSIKDKADNAVQKVKVNGTELDATGNAVNISITKGSTNGTVAVNGTDVAVHGLESAAYQKDTAFESAGKVQELKDDLGSMAWKDTSDYTSMTEFDQLKVEVLGTDKNYGTSRIDLLENAIGRDDTENTIKYRIKTVEADIDECELDIETIQGRIQALESKETGEYKGEITAQSDFDNLNSQSLNENDYWYINSSETITITFDVKVITGDIIIYVGKDTTDNSMIFIKSQQTLNLINGNGKNSIRNILTSNKANGNNSAVFGASNITTEAGNASLVVGTYNEVSAPRSIVGGLASDTNGDTLFAMGNGTLETVDGKTKVKQRQNAVLITKNGDEYLSGDLYIKYTKYDDNTFEYHRLGYPDETIEAGSPATICSTYDGKIKNINDTIGTGDVLAQERLTLIDGINRLGDEIDTINGLIKSDDSEKLPDDNKTIYGNINDIYELIKIDEESLPFGQTIYGNITDIYSLIKHDNDKDLPYSEKTIYGNINEIDDKVENIPQWKIYNTILNDNNDDWEGDDTNGYIYREKFVLDNEELSSDEDLDKYIVLFDIGNTASIAQRKKLIQCSVTAQVIRNNEGKAALQLIALQNPNQDNGNILQGCPITYSYIIGEVQNNASV